MSREKPIDPQVEIIVRACRARREELLKRLEAATRQNVFEVLDELDETERVLLRHDPNFVAPPRRLTFMQPIDAALLLLMESGNRGIPRQELINIMLAHGVCLGNRSPRSDIERALRYKTVQSKLTFDPDTGYVTINREYYEQHLKRKGE